MFVKKSCLFLFLLVQSYIYCDWTSSPITLDSSASSAAPVVVDLQGNVTSASLENYDGLGDDPQAVFFSASSQEWTPSQPIIQAYAGATIPQLIVDDFGTITLVWIEYFNENGNSYTLFASRSTKGNPWTTPVPLNSLPMNISTNAQAPVSMVVDAQGNVTIAWLEQIVTNSNYTIGAARFTSDIDTPPTLYSFLDGSSPNANNNIFPQLVVDQLGYVTAVWQENTGSGFAVQAARLDPSGLAWSTAINLDGSSPNANGGITPQMVVDNAGIVTVIWQEIASAQFSIQAARFTPGIAGANGSWTTYTTISAALSNANGSITPKIVIDKNGSVTIVAVDANLSVWPASFSNGSSSWTSPSFALNISTAFSLTPLSMVVDNAGIVTILWLNNTSGLFVQAARGFSTSWDSAMNLDSGNANSNTPLLAVIDNSGTVTASWIEGSAMQASRFLSSGSSWTEAATLDNGNVYNQIPPKMMVGPSGAVTVVWQEGPEAGSYAIQAARFTPGETSWTPPTTLNNGSQVPNAYYSSMAQQINMVVDAFDNVTVTWLETINPVVVVQSARFSAIPTIGSIDPNQGPTTGGTSVIISGINFNNVSNVLFGSNSAAFEVNNSSQITAVSPSGDIGIVDITVITNSGTSPISNNDKFTYFISAPLPPSSISGKQIKNRFLTQLDIVNIIKWTAPTSGIAPTYYKIYRNNLDTLIGTLSAEKPLKFADHNRLENVVYTYYVVSIDSHGNSSTPISISIVPN